MRKPSRLFLLGALILVLTAACGADQGATPTLVGTLFPPQDGELTSTPLGGTADTTQIAGTDTAGSETPTAAATDGAATQAAATTGTTQNPGIPVTGPDIVLVECQFCVDTIANALLVLPDTATFQVVSPVTSDNATNCSTVEVNDGRQVVLCSGPGMTPITLNICTNGSTCRDFPIDLLACPLTQTNNTPSAPGTGGGIAISTSTSSTIVNTPTP